MRPCPIPEGALLQAYLRDGAYADCYAADIDRPVSHAEYVEAFYTTWVFGLEAMVLSLLGKPSTDADAKALADGTSATFAAWSVEGRASSQLLLCDFTRRTRSWLMVVPAGAGTRLYFGSAVVSLGLSFRLLLGFHKLYSRVLLHAARARLEKAHRTKSKARQRS
jgi:hypothetical protein